jgi:hypothetical protein
MIFYFHFDVAAHCLAPNTIGSSTIGANCVAFGHDTLSMNSSSTFRQHLKIAVYYYKTICIANFTFFGNLETELYYIEISKYLNLARKVCKQLVKKKFKS